MKKERLMPPDHWDWSIRVPFSQGWKVGNLVFIGGQVSLDRKARVVAAGDIEAQTHNAFHFVENVLREGGSDLADLVKFNTWYQFEGSGPALKDYWERMTRVRLEYLRNPGPVGTALRIAGLGYADLLIEIDGVAAAGGRKKRLMPKNHWDWSIPVPLSQGWIVDDHLFIGGQVSADSQGNAVAEGDIVAQTHNTYRFIQNVLGLAGADFSDLVQVNIFYRFDGSDSALEDYVNTILGVSRDYIKEPYPSGVIMRVNGLAYEGLLIEIEAIATLRRDKTVISPSGHWRWKQATPFSQGVRTGDFVYVTGQLSADQSENIVGPGDIEAQTHNAFQNLEKVLTEAGSSMGDLVKLYTFYYCDEEGEGLKRYWERMTNVRMQYLRKPGPSGTAIRVNGFHRKGQLIEIQGVAAIGD